MIDDKYQCENHDYFAISASRPINKHIIPRLITALPLSTCLADAPFLADFREIIMVFGIVHRLKANAEIRQTYLIIYQHWP